MINHFHLIIFREARNQIEDRLIEWAEYLLKKGVDKDSVTYDGHTMFELAIENSNTNLALWLFKKGISQPSKDDFIKEVDENQYNYGYQTNNFLYNLTNYSSGVDWEPIIRVLINELDKKTLHYLLESRSGGQVPPLTNLVKTKPYSGYGRKNKLVIHENKIYLQYLDLLFDMAKAWDFDVAVQMKIDKNSSYYYRETPQEKVDEMIENVNESKLDSKVNGFGLFDLTFNQNDPIYLPDNHQFNIYRSNTAKSNMLHSLITDAGDQINIIG